MKTKSLKRTLSILLTLFLLSGLGAALALDTAADAPSSVFVGGVEVGGSYPWLLADGMEVTDVQPSAEYTGGYAHYADGVLTLSDFEYSGGGKKHDTTESSTLYATGDVELVLVGTNSLTNTDDPSIWGANAIYVTGDLTVGGKGQLTVSAPWAIIVKNGDFAVDGGKLNVGLCMYPLEIQGTGNAIFNGGTVTLAAKENAILVEDGDITLNGGTLNATTTSLLKPTLSATVGSIILNSGSVTATSGKQAFSQAFIVDNPSYWDITASTNADGTNPADPYDADAIASYKYLKLEKHEYIYLFSPKEGLGSNELSYAWAGETVTLPEPGMLDFAPPIPEEGDPPRRFKAWEIGNGTGVFKQPGDTVTITEETYIYAIWEEIPEYLYAYYPGDGADGSPDTNYAYEGDEIVLATCMFSPYEGKIFDKWEIGHDTGVFKQPGEMITITNETYIYAIWRDDPSCGVWIGGTEIRESNQDDVFGDGKVSYDSETKTLTLNNYAYSGAGYTFQSGCDAVIFSTNALKLQLTGANSLTYAGESAGFGIVVGSGALTVAGEGSLTVNAGVAGIFTKDESVGVTLSGGQVTLRVTDAEMGMGILTNAFLQTGGTLSIESPFLGIYLPMDDATAVISGGRLTVAGAAGKTFATLVEGVFTPVTPDLSLYTTYLAVASTNADGSGATAYREEDLATYRYFNLIPAYTVSFSANGGGGTMDDVGPLVGEYTLPTCGFTPPADKRFLCWSVAGVEYDVGGTVDVTGNVEVIAVWEEIPSFEVTVTDGNADCGDSAKVGDTVTLTASPAASGYYFSGWTVVSGGVTLTDASAATTTFVMGESAVEVKANYTAKQVIEALYFTVSAPGAGQTQPTDLVCLTPGLCTVTNFSWYGYVNGSDKTLSAEDTFSIGEVYYFYFELSETEHYLINESTKFYLNGELTDQHNHMRRRVFNFVIPAALTVIGGGAYSDESYEQAVSQIEPGNTVYFKANTPPAGQVFVRWEITGYEFSSTWTIYDPEFYLYFNYSLSQNVTVRAIFATPIDEINVSIPRLEVGATPNGSVTDDSEYCTVEITAWLLNYEPMDPTDPFALDTRYVARLLFTPSDGYCLTDDTVVKFNGKYIYLDYVYNTSNSSTDVWIEDLMRTTVQINGAKLMVDGEVTNETKFLVGTQITLIPDETMYPAGQEFAYWNISTNAYAVGYDTLKSATCVITVKESNCEVQGYAFYRSPSYLTSLSSSVTAPRPGETPSYDPQVSQYAYYTADVLGWYEGATLLEEDHVFEAGKTYTVRVRFDTIPSYYINAENTTGVRNVFVSGRSGIPGSVIEYDVNETYMIVDFSYEALYSIESVTATLTGFSGGVFAETIGATAPVGAHYTLDIYGFEVEYEADLFRNVASDELLAVGAKYRITIGITPEAGYEIISDGEVILINGEEASYRGAGSNGYKLYYVDLVLAAGAEQFDVSVDSATASVDEAPVTEAAGGVTVTLVANAAPAGMEFLEWQILEGENVSLANPQATTTTFVMPAENVSIKAVYRNLPHAVTAEGGTASHSEAGEGETVTVTAQDAPAGKYFAGWECVSGGVTFADPDAKVTTFVMTGEAVSVRAIFLDKEYLSRVDLSVTAPAIGATPDMTPASTEPSKYTVSLNYWYYNGGSYPHLSAEDTYEEGASYSIRVSVEATERYYVDGNTKFYLNGIETGCYGSVGSRESSFRLPWLITVNGGKLQVNGEDQIGLPSNGSGVLIADAPAVGTRFAGWVINSGEVSITNAGSPTTEVWITTGSAEITATYVSIYTITVTDGVASVDHEATGAEPYSTVVTVTADPAPDGYVFDKWVVVSGDVTFASADSATTTFEMPAEAVSVKATYKKVHVHVYGAYSHDSTQHWQVCTDPACPDPEGSTKGRSGHGGGEATCETLATCTTCGQSYGGYAEHEYGEKIAAVGETHTQTTLSPSVAAHYYCSVCHTYFTESKVETTLDALTGETPTHTFGSWLMSDAEHWRACSCGKTDDRNSHAYTDASDMICNTCEYDRSVPHTHGNGEKINGQAASCTSDGWKDYYRCSCGEYFLEAACTNAIADLEAWKLADGKIAGGHNYGTPIAKTDANCTETGMHEHYECSACHALFDANKVAKTAQELTISNNDSHSFGAWTSNGDDTHTRTCSRNAAHKETDDCSGGSATCTQKAICSICNTAYGAFSAHDHSDEWSKSETKHWHECACGNKADENDHTPGAAATETQPQTCTVCGYILSPATGHVTHTPSDTWSKNETHHWHECTGCVGQELDKDDHDLENACDTLCDTCGQTRQITHDHADTWSKNETKHWHECACGDKADENDHDWENACDTLCDTCGQTRQITHDHANTWSKSETKHWHECACGDKADENDHDWENACDTLCDTCGQTRQITHDHADTWSKNETKHWHECACGDKADESDHDWENACDTLCDTCGQTRQITHDHADTWSKNETKHWHECACGDKADESDHDWENACDTLCDTCGQTRQITHDYADTWSKNETKHWHECACGDKADESDHDWENACDTLCDTCGQTRQITHDYGTLIAKTDANCTETGMQAHYECSVCHALFDANKVAKTAQELTIATNDSHDFGAWTSNGDDTHTRTCSRNAAHKETDDCDGGSATCTQKAICPTCNTAYGTLAAHDHADTWSKNETKHWHECACGDKADEAAHSFGDWTVTKQPDATEAGSRTRTCVCGATETEVIPATGETPAPRDPTVDPGEEDPGLSGGAIAAICVGSVAVAGCGGFALFWFVIKKKTWAELLLAVKSLIRKP